MSPSIRAADLPEHLRKALGPNSPLLPSAGRKHPRERENVQHRAVVMWADDPKQRERWPELAWLFHPPNGGYRTPKAAVQMKRLGVKPGVPDLWLPVHRAGYTGLVIELKPPVEKGEKTRQPTEYQLAWLYHLAEEGWMAGVCHGSAEAIAKLTAYLSLPPK